MATEISYYLILFVYTSLWSCQLIACHLTHSLIILTDSYINLYKILDVSLGLLHLKTQRKLEHNATPHSIKQEPGASSQPLKLFNRICTYNFRRLPLLGGFVNGLFLAALLMSAAIEGIQTCFHASHSQIAGERSILLEHPITYPALLAGFALVGIIMQWCTGKAHEMREIELRSESLLDMRRKAKLVELDVHQLTASDNTNEMRSSEPPKFSPETQLNARKILVQPKRVNSFCVRGSNETPGRNKYVVNTHNRGHHRSLESVVTGLHEPVDISLQSMTMNIDQDSENLKFGKVPSSKVESDGSSDSSNRQRNKLLSDKWQLVRYFVSPFALTSCAAIVYFINHEMVTEIADAALAITVVILLFTASYPPMKKAGRVLLQTAPEKVNLERLKSDLMSISPSIIRIDELRVWSLTSRTNRIATCHLVLDRSNSTTEHQISKLLSEAKSKFLKQDIKCLTIEPKLVDPKAEKEESLELEVKTT